MFFLRLQQMVFIRIGFLHSENLFRLFFQMLCCALFVLSLVCFRCCAFMRNKSLHFNKRHLKVLHGVRVQRKIVSCCFFLYSIRTRWLFYYFFVQVSYTRTTILNIFFSYPISLHFLRFYFSSLRLSVCSLFVRWHYLRIFIIPRFKNLFCFTIENVVHKGEHVCCAKHVKQQKWKIKTSTEMRAKEECTKWTCTKSSYDICVSAKRVWRNVAKRLKYQLKMQRENNDNNNLAELPHRFSQNCHAESKKKAQLN